ncbi:MAG: hypothetical protein ACTIA3_08095 [Corynebacterium casei]|uniref:Uncharacterized protein n=2 Tax=Corynebacterium casei TaxID=160386 RepID=G7HZ96_9CORY|nr:hypothetical protein [Corynebacterium casei]AHI20591.1 hypothetical protein CCASEI_10180 [Corynebacterium casei LMG S-19264]MDN5706177.1 hypothetical protein [Corynebacterium casei]MDN5728692.1 hypothetical protein [Corynebacterium casei]MDN5740156.1 hypothetical protein [Corynebacterium casei]MDN5784155.1 hypothetical protein [Corynebacterium casei]
MINEIPLEVLLAATLGVLALLAAASLDLWLAERRVRLERERQKELEEVRLIKLFNLLMQIEENNKKLK